MVSVPLNAMCSNMCARPVLPVGSCTEPASTCVKNENTGASGRSQMMMVRPLASFFTVVRFSNEARSWPKTSEHSTKQTTIVCIRVKRDFILPPRLSDDEAPKSRSYVEAGKIVKRAGSMAKQSHRRDAACRVSCVRHAKLLPPVSIHFFFQCKTINRRQRQREKETDSPVKNKKRLAEGAFDFGGVSMNGSRIGHSPVRGHGMSRPDRAGFLGGVVANREAQLHLGGARPREFIPALAAQADCGNARQFKLLQRFGMHRPRGMTSCAVGGEDRLSLVVEDRFGHDGTRRVSRTQKQSVVVSFHG